MFLQGLRHARTTRKSLQMGRALTTGQLLPAINLREGSPGNLVTLQPSNAIVVGTPAAFSPGCSQSHVPGFVAARDQFRDLGFKEIYVIAVNDAFVMKAWKESFGDVEGIRFLADHDASWTKEAKMDFDASAILGNVRSKRFAAVIRDGKIQHVFEEPDNIGITVSSAESVLKQLKN